MQKCQQSYHTITLTLPYYYPTTTLLYPTLLPYLGTLLTYLTTLPCHPTNLPCYPTIYPTLLPFPATLLPTLVPYPTSVWDQSIQVTTDQSKTESLFFYYWSHTDFYGVGTDLYSV